MPPTPISLLVVATAITLSTSFSPNLRANNDHLTDPFVLPPALQEKNKYDAHQVRLESLGYFFKTYTARADQALDHARETVRRVLGDDVVQQKVFAGRASLFEEAGSLHKYVPLVYELAGIKGEHKKEKHKRLPMNHTIAMIEERMELGLIDGLGSLHSVTRDQIGVAHMRFYSPEKTPFQAVIDELGVQAKTAISWGFNKGLIIQ